MQIPLPAGQGQGGAHPAEACWVSPDHSLEPNNPPNLSLDPGESSTVTPNTLRRAWGGIRSSRIRLEITQDGQDYNLQNGVKKVTREKLREDKKNQNDPVTPNTLPTVQSPLPAGQGGAHPKLADLRRDSVFSQSFAARPKVH